MEHKQDRHGRDHQQSIFFRRTRKGLSNVAVSTNLGSLGVFVNLLVHAYLIYGSFQYKKDYTHVVIHLLYLVKHIKFHLITYYTPCDQTTNSLQLAF